MIPCEWQTSQNRRKRQRPTARDRPKSSSPPPTASTGRTILRVGDQKLLQEYYNQAFEDFQQLNCRAIAKSYIKLVEPRKQVHFPYNGRKVISGVSQRVDPELTKPGWWPEGVIHKEPDHLKKDGRVQLLVHILCRLKDSHGITAEKLREAGQDVRRQITPANRLDVLDEIYFVRQMEEQFIDGEIDANTLIQVSHTKLSCTENQEGEILSPTHAPPVSARSFNPDVEDVGHSQSGFIDRTNPGPPPDQPGLPLSPATSDSSGPRSPTNTSFTTYPVHLNQPAIPQEPMIGHKSVLQPPTYLPGYYPQQFAPQKTSADYWPNVPSMPDVSPYGY